MVRGGRVGGISIISGVWVVRAVPPPTCAHVGSVGALAVLITTALAVGTTPHVVPELDCLQ